MWNYFKVVTTLGLIIAISGCATLQREANKHDRDYLSQAKSVPPTQVPSGLNLPESQSYYPIPPVTLGPVNNGQPSILPPGSQVAVQAQQQPSVNNSHPTPMPTSIVTASSSNALVLGVNFNQAWEKVSRGLRASGYKVMQQDKSVGGFFIVNEAETGGQLTAKTPIYQVHLTPIGNNTTVTLLNDKNQLADPAVSVRVLGALKARL